VSSVKINVWASIDYSTHDFSVPQANDNNIDDIFLFQLGIMGGYIYPRLDKKCARDIEVKNYTTKSKDSNTFKDSLNFQYAKVSHLTQKNVNVVTGMCSEPRSPRYRE
jgi:hypothetical protein